MRAVGIIAEFDPFHDGHAYLIREAKRLTGADYVVVAMSGDFVERGEPAVFDKFERARSAVLGGADAVFELPTAYATSGARIFSEAGVRLLASTGVVDSICFGSECGDIDMLYRASELLDNESEEFKMALAGFQKEGYSYPKAREKALLESGVSEEYVNMIREPNNILGIHYISAIRNYCPEIKAYTIKRVGAGYHECGEVSGFESATGIRNKILNKELTTYGNCPIQANDFSQLLFAKLLEMSADDLKRIADVSDSLIGSLLKHREKSMGFTELIQEVKSKNNLHTQVARALLHIILGMTVEMRGDCGKLRIPYLRLLAFRDSSSGLLRMISDNAFTALVTKAADAPCRRDELFLFDIKAASLYNSTVYAKYGVRYPEDITRGPQIVK